MSEAAEAVRGLAAILRSGASTREALSRWASQAPPAVSGYLQRAARRAALGASASDALAVLEERWGDDALLFRRIVALHGELGGDLPAMLDTLAGSIERRHRARQLAAAHAAGVKISARMVASLPIFFIPMSPLGRAPLFDAAGAVMLVLGVSLAAAGMCWIGRLMPEPPDGVTLATALSSIVGGATAGGASPHQALTACAEVLDDPTGGAQRAARRVRLGLSWSESLMRSSDASLRALGEVLATSVDLGIPVADALHRFEAARVTEETSRVEAEVRRAPVKMIVPLAVCILPAFAILGAGPFLRGLFT